MKNTLKIVFVSAILLFAGGAEANNCSFYRTLGVGSRGEDVRCLQQYLVSSGYGSYIGWTDGVYGARTAQAVMAWQASYSIYPNTGYFDGASQSIYYQVAYQTPVTNGGGIVLGASTTNLNSDEERARQKIERALREMDKAEEEIEDSNDDTDDAEEMMEEADDDMLDAMNEFFVRRNFNRAGSFADDAFENAKDAFEEAGGDDGDREDASDAIDDAEDAIDDAKDEIRDARNDGDDTDEAEDLLEEAEDALEDAEDAFDDRDYDEAEDSAEDAIDLANDAIDELN